jgi:hypothetical protein
LLVNCAIDMLVWAASQRHRPTVSSRGIRSSGR